MMDKMNGHPEHEMSELRQLKSELDQLSSQITSLSLILLSPPPRETESTKPIIGLGKSSAFSNNDETPLARKKTRLSRFTFKKNKNKSTGRKFDVPIPIPSPTFRFGFGKNDNNYDKLEETKELLANDSRRGSADSDMTLVNSPPSREIKDHNFPRNSHSPDHLLNLLAPLVSSLQRLSRRLSIMTNITINTIKSFERVCQQLLDLICNLTPNAHSGNIDNHELEMSVLMLDALTKKVQHELNTINSLSLTPTPISETEEEIAATPNELRTERQLSTSTSSSGTSTSTTLSISPLNLTKNPYILHSTSIDVPTITLANPNRQRGSISKSISSCTTTSPNVGEYTEFVSKSQNTSMTNVIRLGSFQASMLFSPSPIAVRRIANGSKTSPQKV